MSNKKVYDQKHLTTTQRIKIEKGLMDGISFASIARDIQKHPSTVAKEFSIGRTYEDFQKYMREHPDVSVVEMDTVEGGHGNSKQAFLTILFRNCSLMLIFVLAERYD